MATLRLTEADQARIADAVARVEAGSGAEVVCVLARRSEDFRLVGVAWAGALALLVPWPLLLTPWAVTTILTVQMLLFLALGALLVFTPALQWVTPRAWQRREAAQVAREQFLAQGLHRTHGRVGVLLFVSLAEHHAEIIADVGLDGRVAPTVWQQAVALLTQAARDGRLADGVVAALDHLAPVLATACPRGADDSDELPNLPVLM